VEIKSDVGYAARKWLIEGLAWGMAILPGTTIMYIYGKAKGFGM